MMSLPIPAPFSGHPSETADAWFRVVADAAPSLIWLSTPDKLRAWFNQSWLQFTGRGLEEETGFGWTELVFPEDLEGCLKTYQEACESQQPFELKYRLKHHSGEYRWILDSAGPIFSPGGEFTGYIGICTDIHRQKLAIEKERAAAHHFRTLADATPHRIATARPDGYVEWFNRQWFEYSGLTMEALQGDGWAYNTLHPDEIQSTLQRWHDAVAAGQPMEIEHRFRNSEGVYRWHVTRVAPMRDAHGNIALWIGVNTDIDAIKQAHEAVRAASRAKDEFIAALSHELRTPLTPVLLLSAELQSDPQLPQEFRDAISTIRHNAELEARLIDDLLDLTHIVHGKLRIRLETADLHSLLRYTEEVVGNVAREKNITLAFDLAATASTVRADAARLQQVAWNLFNNAVKFSPEGTEVTVRSFNPDPGHICFEVRDHGVGIPPERLPHVFDAFGQSAGGAHRFGGLGLGLAISKAIMEMHGGTLSAKSEGPGKGATFSVTLETVTTDSAAPSTAINGHASTQFRILLVEDHPPTLRVLEKLLSRDGHTVTTASTVAAALEAGRNGEFDLLVSDLGLPDGSGCEIIETLRLEKPIPGIALSGYGMDSDLERSHDAGFARHLIKPIDFAQLRQALRETAAPAK